MRCVALLGAEIGLERLLAEAADPSEEVELPGRQAKIGAVLPADGRVAAAGEVARRARGRLTDPGVDRREAVGTLDAILSAGLLDVERRDPQVAVVGQCEFDQLAQSRVGEIVPPRDIRYGAGLAVRGDTRKLVGTGAAGRS